MDNAKQFVRISYLERTGVNITKYLSRFHWVPNILWFFCPQQALSFCILRQPGYPFFLAAGLFRYCTCINLPEVICCSTVLEEHLASVLLHGRHLFAVPYEIHQPERGCWPEGLNGTRTSQFQVKEVLKVITPLATSTGCCLEGRYGSSFIAGLLADNPQLGTHLYLLTRYKVDISSWKPEFLDID